VLELIPTRASVVSSFATTDALAELSPPAGTYLCWIAADEAMLVGPPGEGTRRVWAVRDAVRNRDEDAVVLDVSDGWTLWTLAGGGAREAFLRLSDVELEAEGYVQGDVARVPVRVIALGERLHLLVPAMWEEHLRDRIRAAASDLDLRTSPATDWGLP
jgi:sarcosine oxidase gamma subunit family protein